MTKHQLVVRLDVGPDIVVDFTGMDERDNAIKALVQAIGSESYPDMAIAVGGKLGVFNLDHVIAAWAKEVDDATGADSD